VLDRPWGSRRLTLLYFKTTAHGSGRVVSTTHRPSLPSQELYLVLLSAKRWVHPSAIIRPQGLYKWKIRMTSPGIEPATFRLVVQCPANCATACPIKVENVKISGANSSLCRCQSRTEAGTVFLWTVISHPLYRAALKETWQQSKPLPSSRLQTAQAERKWAALNMKFESSMFPKFTIFNISAS
jgi:hypothetical protein